jgi:hypothetical protein
MKNDIADHLIKMEIAKDTTKEKNNKERHKFKEM